MEVVAELAVRNKKPQPLARLRPLFLTGCGLQFLYASTKAFSLREREVTQLAEGLGFDLADAFAGDLEALADFFQGVLGSRLRAEAHLDDALFAG